MSKCVFFICFVDSVVYYFAYTPPPLPLPPPPSTSPHVLRARPLIPSSRAFRHWSRMMSSTVKTIEPTSPVSVSSHTHRGTQSDTRSDVAPAE